MVELSRFGEKVQLALVGKSLFRTNHAMEIANVGCFEFMPNMVD